MNPTSHGGPLAGRRWGGGERSALLLHGSTSSAATWWHIGPALAELGWAVTALDLPSHGTSPRLHAPLTPSAAAGAVLATLQGRRFELLVGHSFGASTAVALLEAEPALAERLVLEELPGPDSVDWQAEAASVRDGAAEARADLEGTVARARVRQPRWSADDCRHAICDLGGCADQDVAAGLERGATWPLPDRRRVPATPTLLLLASDAPGINHLEDATALRGADRAAAIGAATAVRIFDTGHCIHRDNPGGWLDAVNSFTATTRRVVLC